MNQENTILIFTDGAARGNPGPGGWGAIVKDGVEVTELGGGEGHTTNNRMEMMAAIQALKSCELSAMSCQVTVYTDSAYVLNGATKWLKGWKAKNWITSTKQPVLNQDLWEELSNILDVYEEKIDWKLLPGHSGIPANERCDVIATSFADNADIQLYNGPAKDYFVDLDNLKVSAQAAATKKRSSSAKPYSYVSAVGGKVMTHSNWADCEKRVKGQAGARFKKVFSAEEEKTLSSEWAK